MPYSFIAPTCHWHAAPVSQNIGAGIDEASVLRCVVEVMSEMIAVEMLERERLKSRQIGAEICFADNDLISHF